MFEIFHKMLVKAAWETIIATMTRKASLKIFSGVITSQSVYVRAFYYYYYYSLIHLFSKHSYIT